MVNEKRLMFLASEVTIAEEDKLNPVFLSIRMKLADNAGNRNDEGITAAFISDLINRQDEFNGLPFYADTKKLIARKYDELGHMYNRITKKFGTTQIGSLVDFYSETDNDGVISLYATARVPKRENEICIRLVELYELGKLCVSFEVRYNPEYTIEKDGVLFIDANEDNAMTGIALVSTPACVDAVALDMVAEVADDSDIVAECEEHVSERGETETMPKKKEMTAEVETEIAEEIQNAEAEQEEKPVAVAEGEGASESAGEGASESGGEGASESGDGGEGASESGGEGASESGEGASESGSGAGGSEGDEGSGDGDTPTVDNDVPTIDPDDDGNRANAETEAANAEVLEHSVTTHESVEQWCPDSPPVHVIEYHERIIETMEEAGTVIAELETKIAELEEIKSKYDAIIAEEEAKALAQKRECAKAFAEKQGLNVEDTAVAEAIEKLDYAKIAELTMAEANDEKEEEPAAQVITLASYVEMEVSDDKYGGLLGRRNK